jgi:hypothetical protein
VTFAVLPTQVWLGTQRKITRSIRPCNQPRVMNSEPTDYEGGLMNCASKIMAVKYQVLGETHGLPYLATLYCAEGRWHRSCLSCCSMLRTEARSVHIQVRHNLICLTLLERYRSTYVISLSMYPLYTSEVHAPLNKIRAILKRITIFRASSEMCSLLLLEKSKVFHCWHNVDENEVV